MMIKGPARSIDVVCIKKDRFLDGEGWSRWTVDDDLPFWDDVGIYVPYIDIVGAKG